MIAAERYAGQLDDCRTASAWIRLETRRRFPSMEDAPIDAMAKIRLTA
jgi:hypothetical protein